MEPKAPFAKCEDCPLQDQPIVRGWGPATTDRVLVGEAPARQEVIQGKPFVGPAGMVLSNELNRACVDRTALYITNAVLCRFPEGISEDEKGRAVEACRDRLVAEIRRRMPGKVLALGGTAAMALTRGRRSIEDLRRERPTPAPDLDPPAQVRVTYHPSSFKFNREWRDYFREDITWLRTCDLSDDQST